MKSVRRREGHRVNGFISEKSKEIIVASGEVDDVM